MLAASSTAHLDRLVVHVTQSVWRGRIHSTKSDRPRSFDISPDIATYIRSYLMTQRKPNDLNLLFPSRRETPREQNNFLKRNLYPLLDRLGIPRKGLHALRHFNITEMDREGVPWATRQERVGHADSATTKGYTHPVSDDGKKLAAKLGRKLRPHAPNSSFVESDPGMESQLIQ